MRFNKKIILTIISVILSINGYSQNNSNYNFHNVSQKITSDINVLLNQPCNEQAYQDYISLATDANNRVVNGDFPISEKDFAINYLQGILPDAKKIEELRRKCNNQVGTTPTQQTNSNNNNNLSSVVSQMQAAQIQQNVNDIHNNIQNKIDQIQQSGQEYQDKYGDVHYNADKSNVDVTNTTNSVVKSTGDDFNMDNVSLDTDSKNTPKLKPKTIYYYTCTVNITNNTNKNLAPIGGLNYSAFTIFNQIPCSGFDEKGNGIFVDNCMSTSFTCGIGGSLVIGKEGYSYSGSFWSENLLEEKIPAWTFSYEYYYLQNNLYINGTDKSVNANLVAGSDLVQANTPLKIESHGVQPLTNVLFEDKGVIFSYSLTLVKTMTVFLK